MIQPVERPFDCNEMMQLYNENGTDFSLKDNQQIHCKTHNNEKLYRCDECDKNFTKSGYYSHRLIHAGIKKYVCHLCGKKFMTNSLLKRHYTSNAHKSTKLELTLSLNGKRASVDKPHESNECVKSNDKNIMNITNDSVVKPYDYSNTHSNSNHSEIPIDLTTSHKQTTDTVQKSNIYDKTLSFESHADDTTQITDIVKNPNVNENWKTCSSYVNANNPKHVTSTEERNMYMQNKLKDYYPTEKTGHYNVTDTQQSTDSFRKQKSYDNTCILNNADNTLPTFSTDIQDRNFVRTPNGYDNSYMSFEYEDPGTMPALDSPGGDFSNDDRVTEGPTTEDILNAISNLKNIEDKALKAKMKRRMKNVNRRCKCEECGKEFSQPSCLKNHRIVHTGEKPFECDVCDAKFARISSLQRHYLIHTGDRPHKCDVCEVKFTTLHGLKKHKMIHLDEKAYKCGQCGKEFSHSDTLRAHIKTHTGDRPYRCEECDKSFSKSGYYNHRLTHTGLKPHECHLCGKCFMTNAMLRKHIKIHTRLQQNSDSQDLPDGSTQVSIDDVPVPKNLHVTNELVQDTGIMNNGNENNTSESETEILIKKETVQDEDSVEEPTMHMYIMESEGVE